MEEKNEIAELIKKELIRILDPDLILNPVDRAEAVKTLLENYQVARKLEL